MAASHLNIIKITATCEILCWIIELFGSFLEDLYLIYLEG